MCSTQEAFMPAIVLLGMVREITGIPAMNAMASNASQAVKGREVLLRNTITPYPRDRPLRHFP
jgi:hypothetical protein